MPAADGAEVGGAVAQDAVDVVFRADIADRHGRLAGFLADAGGERNLEQVLGRRPLGAGDIAARAIHHIDSGIVERLGNCHAVIDGIATVFPIGRRDSREQRLGLGSGTLVRAPAQRRCPQ